MIGRGIGITTAFSDAYTYKGMADMAAAFREAGLPEADRLANDADEYRQCILDTLHRVEFTDPDSGLLFVPNTVYYRQGERGGVWLLRRSPGTVRRPHPPSGERCQILGFHARHDSTKVGLLGRIARALLSRRRSVQGG